MRFYISTLIPAANLIFYMARHSMALCAAYRETSRHLHPIFQDLRTLKVFGKNDIFLVGAVGGIIFDTVAESRIKGKRSHVASIITRLSILGGIADDFLDEHAKTIEEKHEFLSCLTGALFHGDEFSLDKLAVAKRVPLWLALNIFESVFSKDMQSWVAPVWNDLISCAQQQFIETDPERLLCLEQMVARRTLELFVLVVELSEGRQVERLRTALGYLGGYGQALDNFNDLDSDLEDGIRTYGTAYLQLNGNCHEVRAAIKCRYQKEAELCRRQAMANLKSSREKRLVCILKTMMDARCHSYSPD